MNIEYFTTVISLFIVISQGLQVFQNDQVLTLIENAGYNGEAHQVDTEDGYILKLHRIIPKKSNGLKPVLLCHGILATSADFLITGPQIALAYLLSDYGHDVWLGNSRGSKHSTQHRIYSPESREYWNFSWHQMGIFDMPAVINYILNQTNNSSLNFIGHSQATTSLLVLLSQRPEYNSKINQAHLFAPPAFRKKLPRSIIVSNFLRYLDGHEEFKFLELQRLFRFGKIVGKSICKDNDLLIFMTCKRLIRIAFGGNKSREIDIETKLIPRLVKYLSPRVSTMQLTHYYQNMVSGKFQEYDYKDKNLIYYNSITPREYDLSRVTAPLYLYHAAYDNLVTEEGAAYLKSLLPNVRKYHVINDWNHIDFVYNRSARKVLYYDVLSALDNSSESIQHGTHDFHPQTYSNDVAAL